MNKVYDFGWLVKEIDGCIILKLKSGEETKGVYQISEIKNISLDNIEVRFANVSDLINFIKHCKIRFRDVNNNDNFIDIPIYKMWLLFLNSNNIGEEEIKMISLSELDATFICDKRILDSNYLIYSYKIKEESSELKDVMVIAYNFDNLGMQDTIDALNKINLINYHMSCEVNRKRY